jgi:glutamate-1-semialdehyde 2,1-aminomutase
MRSWQKSQALLERAKSSLAGGVSSPFRAMFPQPLYFENGCGARLRDVDGNEYIDYVLGWGPNILGYRHPAMVEAMRRQADLPYTYGEQHELEITVAEKIQQCVPCAERVAFTSSGSEAVQITQRLARAFTGRNLILKFEGHYHGWMDGALLGYKTPADQLGPLEGPPTTLGSQGQVPNAAENVVVAPWNRLDILERILARHARQVAAVMMEPVLCNSGCILPEPGYLEGVRDLCRRHEALLVFDEVITGFRMHLGGAQAFYGITPDLATFGKSAAAGLPLSVVAGREEILRLMFGGGVAFGGTFNGNPVSLAAAEAALTELAREGGKAIEEANRRGERLMKGICDLAAERGIDLLVSGFGTAFALHFTGKPKLLDYRDTLADDKERLRVFLRRALEAGIHIVPDGRMYTSAAHTDSDIDATVSALRRAFET